MARSAMQMPIYTPEPEFKGLGIVGKAQAAAESAAAPAMQASQFLQQQQQQSEADAKTKAQAAQFQKLLQTGVQGMQGYVQEISGTQPELGQRFAAQLQNFAPLLSDPNIKREKAWEMTSWIYDSWDKQVKEANKLPELTFEQKQAQTLDTHRKTKEIDKEFEKPQRVSDAAKDRARKLAMAEKKIGMSMNNLIANIVARSENKEESLDDEAKAAAQDKFDKLWDDLNSAEIEAGGDATPKGTSLYKSPSMKYYTGPGFGHGDSDIAKPNKTSLKAYEPGKIVEYQGVKYQVKAGAVPTIKDGVQYFKQSDWEQID